MNDLFQEDVCPCCKRPYEAKVPVYGFTEFWAKVPHKIGKAAAEKAWKKLNAANRGLAIEKVGPFYDWFKREYPTASPLHPSTYLSNARWEDETITPSTAAVKVNTDTEAAIRKGLQSKIQSVREHAEKMAKAAGLSI